MSKLTNKVWVLLIISLLLPASHAWAAWKPSITESLTPESINSKLKPIGEVDVDGDAGTQTAFVAGPGSGKKRYEAYCKACHAAGVSGAPKFREQSDWTTRLSKGIDGLLSSAINGIGVMPPRGGCNSCSDEELKLAIEHMIPQS